MAERHRLSSNLTRSSTLRSNQRTLWKYNVAHLSFVTVRRPQRNARATQPDSGPDDQPAELAAISRGGGRGIAPLHVVQ